jgi:hypothetical protein
MTAIFSRVAKDVRELGGFVFVCLAIIIWIGTKACFEFFKEAILYTLQEWSLSPFAVGSRRSAHKRPAADVFCDLSRTDSQKEAKDFLRQSPS